MHETSQLYKDLLTKPYRTDTALQIGSARLVSICTDSELMSENSEPDGPVYLENRLVSMKSSAKVFSGSDPSVGGCIARKINIRILTPQRQIPRQARLVPFVRLSYEGQSSEWIPKGVFYVDTRKKTNVYGGDAVLELEGYDAMLKTEQLYKNTALGESATDIDVVREISAAIGVEVDPRTSNMMTKGFMIPYRSDFTYRESLGFIAALYAGNFIINDLGRLQLITLKGGG